MVAITFSGSGSAVSLASTASPPADPRLAEYRSDWASLPSTPVRGPAAPEPLATRAVPTDAASVHAHALLAADVYSDTPHPPAGYRVASEAELARLGLDPDQLDPDTDGFRARVYASEQPGEGYVIAFRGSQSGADWKADVKQGVGLDTDHYARALEIGRTIARSGAVVTTTGHSLGGGLAATAGIAAGRPADTFNAAGLHPATIRQAQAIAQAGGAPAAKVDNYRVPGEILTALQEGGDHVVGGVLGGIPGAVLLDLPPAYGTQHTLPDVRPAGVNWFEGLNIVDRHGMDWVLAGTAAQLR